MTFDPIQQNTAVARQLEKLIDDANRENNVAAEGMPASDIRFDELLGQMVQDVDSLQKTAETTLHELTGENLDISQKMKDADDAYNLMMQIRHKLVDVYSAVEKHEDS